MGLRHNSAETHEGRGSGKGIRSTWYKDAVVYVRNRAAFYGGAWALSCSIYPHIRWANTPRYIASQCYKCTKFQFRLGVWLGDLTALPQTP